jgi:hypothetical protein
VLSSPSASPSPRSAVPRSEASQRPVQRLQRAPPDDDTAGDVQSHPASAHSAKRGSARDGDDGGDAQAVAGGCSRHVMIAPRARKASRDVVCDAGSRRQGRGSGSGGRRGAPARTDHASGERAARVAGPKPRPHRRVCVSMLNVLLVAMCLCSGPQHKHAVTEPSSSLVVWPRRRRCRWQR